MHTILLLFSVIMCSQSIESIKSQDTIIIFFKNKSKYELKSSNYPDKKIFNNRILYSFSTDFYNTLFFLSGDYLGYDEFNSNLKSDLKIVKKSFFRKNKKKILDIDFFLKNGFKNTFFAIYGKAIYLIDKDEIKKGRVLLKEVKLTNHTFFEE